MSDGSGDAVEMIHRESQAPEFRLEEFPFNSHPVVRFPGDPHQVGVVVAKQDVHWPAELPQFVNDEWGAQIATADESIAVCYEVQSRCEIP